jgi:hypothetical protein
LTRLYKYADAFLARIADKAIGLVTGFFIWLGARHVVRIFFPICGLVVDSLKRNE